MSDNLPDWPQQIYAVLARHGIGQVAYVPDAGLAGLIDLCAADGAMRMVPLTTEEEGIALLGGAWLGGARGTLLMQSSGVGNCINMLALSAACRFPLLMLVTMRGEWGEFNPWQVPMGQAVPAILREAQVKPFKVADAAEAAETVEAAARLAFEALVATAVLISQRIVGTKSFDK